MIYKFTRRDNEISSIGWDPHDFGGCVLIAVNQAGQYNVGDKIYVSCTKYNGIATVQQTVSANSNLYLLATGFSDNGSDSIGFVNNLSLRSYRIEITIKEFGSQKILGKADLAPFTNGIGKIDLQRYVAPYLQLKNDFDYKTTNKRDVNASIKFFITFQEKWFGGEGDLQTDVAQPVFAVNAAKQIGDFNGQNMAEYVIAKDSIQKAQFLTKFKKPVYFSGYPWSISFIYSDLVNPLSIKRIEEQHNINGQALTSVETSLSANETESVNRMMITEDIPANVGFIRLRITTGLAVPQQFVYDGYVPNGYVEVK